MPNLQEVWTYYWTLYIQSKNSGAPNTNNSKPKGNAPQENFAQSFDIMTDDPTLVVTTFP